MKPHLPKRTAYWLLLFVFLSQTATARIVLSVDNQQLTPQKFSLQYFMDTSSQRSFQRYLSIRSLLQSLPDGKADMSYKDGQFWISLDLSSLPVKDSVVYLEIHNPHINYLGAWLLSDDTVQKEFALTGDHLPFKSRSINHNQFVYKLVLKNKNARLVLLIDKRNEQLHVPLNFFTDDRFISYNRTNNMLEGLLAGISVFILLFTLFLYFNMREKLYIYYTLYVLMVAGYIFTDFGLSFMFFYPNLPSIADFARPLAISLAPVCYILFSRSLLNVKGHFPKMYAFTNGYIAFYMFCFVLGFLIVPNTGALRIFWLVFMQVLLIASIVPVLVFAVMGVRKKVEYAGYIIWASLIFTLCTQVYMQYITGNLADTLFTRNAVNIGFSFEICLLALALSIRFKNYKLHAEALLLELNTQQENIFKTVSEYQEKEMNRLSGLLHDSIGAGLSSIKYNLEALDHKADSSALLKSTIDDVTVLTDEVRNISHSLSPVLLQKKGLIKALQDMVAQYNRTGKIGIHLESIGTLHASSFQNELLVYRIIQELLQNVVKHANATEVIIQIILET
ncbi:MAG TPA: 7TM diverse intracellular signaling domain-containing protein, partial [Flavisolibacter sp.]|nr:7TM diverse intracellular signaling domain-containing protein [Flavisolibacter sp.]